MRRRAARQAAVAGGDPVGQIVAARRSRASPRSRSGLCRHRARTRRRAWRPRSPGSPTRSRRRGRARHPGARDPPPTRAPARQSRVVGWRPGPEGHAGVEIEDDVVGPGRMLPPGRLDHDPAADPHHREVGLPRLGPVRLVDDPGPQVADRAQAERLEVAERLARLGRGPLGGGKVARRDVGPDGRRPGRVDPGAEALLDELEGGLDARAAGRDPAEDLGHRLDGLDVGLDGELQPRAGRAAGWAPRRAASSAKRVADLVEDPVLARRPPRRTRPRTRPGARAGASIAWRARRR